MAKRLFCRSTPLLGFGFHRGVSGYVPARHEPAQAGLRGSRRAKSLNGSCPGSMALACVSRNCFCLRKCGVRLMPVVFRSGIQPHVEPGYTHPGGAEPQVGCSEVGGASLAYRKPKGVRLLRTTVFDEGREVGVRFIAAHGGWRHEPRIPT